MSTLQWKTVPTFTATIYVGFKNRTTGETHPESVARTVAQQYCDKVGLCVTFTPTTYIYTNGNEPGVALGLINYPRFPSEREQIQHHAFALAELLLAACEQFKVSIVFPDKTVMIGTPEPVAAK